jgi:hypothetical protein
LTLEEATMATDASDHEQQRRELEEIRRQFAEVSKRMGSAFEPASADEDRERPLALAPPTAPPDARLQPALPAPERPTRPRWQWAAAVALVFVLGTGFGFTLPRSGSSDPPPRTQAPQARTVPSVPQACLETAREGDQVIAMLTRANRDPTLLSKALKEYTVASQACRKEASR